MLVRQSIEACEGPVLRYFLPSDQEGCISPDVGAGDKADGTAGGKAADAAAPSGETAAQTSANTATQISEGSSEPSGVDNK